MAIKSVIIENGVFVRFSPDISRELSTKLSEMFQQGPFTTYPEGKHEDTTLQEQEEGIKRMVITHADGTGEVATYYPHGSRSNDSSTALNQEKRILPLTITKADGILLLGLIFWEEEPAD